MRSFEYDPETGGITLCLATADTKKEPRPVYARELDILGFDRFWDYDKTSKLPYMWAEANRYFYEGVNVGRLKGGNSYDAPEIIIPKIHGQPVMPGFMGQPIEAIDLDGMVKKNHQRLKDIEKITAQRILDAYSDYRQKVDVFQVAFSGGKDSCVLLDIIKKTLPKGSFLVIFGDTGMELPETFKIVEKTKQECLEDDIPFHIATSRLSPKESWELFAPPSRTLRWCCAVHKSTPQMLKLQEIAGKKNITCIAFTGVRRQESDRRSKYKFLDNNIKVQGRLNCHPLLDWTSAEIWLYLYANKVAFNDAYKKGFARVGCICCPMSTGRSRYVEHQNHPEKVNGYFEVIKNSRSKIFDFENFIKSNGWCARKNGVAVKNNANRCHAQKIEGRLIIKINDPASDWREWIKTANIDKRHYSVTKIGRSYVAELNLTFVDRTTRKIFRQVFHKAAYCQACQACEANCKHGALQFRDGKVSIDGCVQCGKCHNIYTGCLRYHSLRHPADTQLA